MAELETGSLTKLLESEGGSGGGVVDAIASLTSLVTGGTSSEKTISMLDPTDYLAGLAGLSGVGDLINKAFFGGGGHHEVTLPRLKIPKKLLASRGIKIPIKNMSVRAYRDFSSVIRPNQDALKRGRDILSRELRGLGFTSEAKKLMQAGRKFNLFKNRGGNVARNAQQYINLLAGTIQALDTLYQTRERFLDDNPAISETLNTLYAENPKSTSKINRSFWQLVKDPTNKSALSLFAQTTGEPFMDLMSQPSPTVDSNALTPLQPTPNPINITVNIPGQSTLGTPTGIRTPKQSASQQTAQNWWNTWSKRILTTGRVVGGVKQAVEFPFFIRSLFTEQEEQMPFFYGENGDQFDFGLPTYPGQQDGTTFISLPQAEAGGFTVEELEESLVGGEQEGSPFSINRFFIPLLVGLILAYVVAKRRK